MSSRQTKAALIYFFLILFSTTFFTPLFAIDFNSSTNNALNDILEQLNSKPRTADNSRTYTIQQDDFLFDDITYKNNTKKTQAIVVKAYVYNKKEHSLSEEKTFVTLKKSTFTLKPKQKIDISYIVSIPNDTPNGTYFNIISIEEKVKIENETAFSRIEDTLITYQVLDSTSTLGKIYYDQSDVKIVVTKKGLPYLFPTEFEYIYTNNSNFVYTPNGTISVQNSDSSKIAEYEINEVSKAIYPGESFTQSYSITLWNSPQSILETKSIVSQTFSDLDGTKITNQINLSILYQVIIVLGVALVLLVGLIVVVITTIKSKKEIAQKK